MKTVVTAWTVERKRIRSRPDLRPLLMFFSVSGTVGERRITAQDRYHYTRPYRLTVQLEPPLAGPSYQLTGLSGATSLSEELLISLEGRPWTARSGRRGQPATLSTDLTEYERLSWETVAQSGPVQLELEVAP